MFGLITYLPTVWQEFLGVKNLKKLLPSIDEKLYAASQRNEQFYPDINQIFHIFNQLKPIDLKVVILGQDPYHGIGQANGLSFSVRENVKIPPSLKNIFKELNADLGHQIPKHGDLTAWVQEGVFLLNATLTVEKGKPFSHKNIGWQSFTQHVLVEISSQLSHIVFMLWGNHAKKYKQILDMQKHCILEASHPSPLARGAFFGCSHFSKANQYLKSNNVKPVHWTIE